MLNFVAFFFFLIVFIVNVCCIYILKERKKIIKLKKKRKTAKHDNAKINVSLNIPCTFLLLKAGAFLQTFFPRKTKIEVFRTSVFFNSKCLTFPLLINLFISLIELQNID